MTDYEEMKKRQIKAQREIFNRVATVPGEKRPILGMLLGVSESRALEVCTEYDRRANLPPGTTAKKSLKDLPEDVYRALVAEGQGTLGTLPRFAGPAGLWREQPK